MNGDAIATDRDFLAWCLRQPGVAHHKLTRLSPNFLVISPPKTGSSWLAANLRCHSGAFVPEDKEIKYFSSFFKWLDLGWYLDQFSPGADRVKGEASPSYAILPVERIRLIRRLMPEVKLVFLMREPIARAWSHAKHAHRYREANFAAGTADFAAVTDAQWRENFAHSWPMASGDYLGQLRRWLSVFPREQVFVGFYESIVTAPEALLRDVFAFLGLKPDVDLCTFRVAEKILVGPAGNLSPTLEHSAYELLHARTVELASYLREHFRLEPPPEWHRILDPRSGCDIPSTVEVFRRESDDRYLSNILQQEEALPSSPCMVLRAYRGYNIVFHAGRMIALAEELGPIHLQETDPAQLQRYFERGSCFFAPSLAEAIAWVDQHVFNRTQGRLGAIEPMLYSLQDELVEAHHRITKLEISFTEAVEVLRHLDAHALRLSPRQIALIGGLRKAWRSLRETVASLVRWPGSWLRGLRDKRIAQPDRKGQCSDEGVAGVESSTPRSGGNRGVEDSTPATLRRRR